jgi:hypothetical protein
MNCGAGKPRGPTFRLAGMVSLVGNTGQRHVYSGLNASLFLSQESLILSVILHPTGRLTGLHRRLESRLQANMAV